MEGALKFSKGSHSSRARELSCLNAAGSTHLHLSLSLPPSSKQDTMTVLEGDELQRLWSLVAELSSQLSSNREQCLALQQQADELKVRRIT